MPDASAQIQAALPIARQIALEAGALLMQHRRQGFRIEYKSGPEDMVTVADKEASALILSRLRAAFPDDGLLSEEETDTQERLSCRRVWIVDPIDGTRSFAQGTDDFCVSIGLAVEGQAVLGVVYAPATDELFEGVVSSPVTPAPLRHRRVCVSDTEYGRELQGWLASHAPQAELLPSHSIALKLARIAYGQAEATFTVAPRSEWDICAGDALLQARGGVLRRRDGRPITYNAPHPHIEQGLIGGYPEALTWLEPLLSEHQIPLSHLSLHPSDPAWALLSSGQQEHWQQAALAGNVHIRYLPAADSIQGMQGTLLALMVSEWGDAGIRVLHSEGQTLQVERLGRNVARLMIPTAIRQS